MTKFDGKEHEAFFAKFMKFTIYSCVAVTILLFLLWLFLIA